MTDEQTAVKTQAKKRDPKDTYSSGIDKAYSRLWETKYSTANRYDIVNNEVYCSRCCDWYDKDTFPLDKNNKHGFHMYCRNCKRADSDKYKQSRADSARRKRYGITADEYDNLFTQQNGVCAICSQSETRVIKGVIASLSVDHDHNTGNIRGLLCGRCNIALGHVEAISNGWFQSAEQYLRTKSAGYHWERVGETPPADPYTLDGNALMMRFD